MSDIRAFTDEEAVRAAGAIRDAQRPFYKDRPVDEAFLHSPAGVALGFKGRFCEIGGWFCLYWMEDGIVLHAEGAGRDDTVYEHRMSHIQTIGQLEALVSLLTGKERTVAP